MKLALVSPVPPLATGISEYAAELLPHLAAEAEVHVLTESPAVIDRSIAARYPCHPTADLPDLLRRGVVDLPVYQVGNSLFHVHQLRHVVEQPGVLVLHDLVLHHVLAAMTLELGDLEGYRALLVENYGDRAAPWAERIKDSRRVGHDRYRLYCRLPLSRHLARASRGVVVHSEYARRRLAPHCPGVPIEVIPHGAEVPDVDRAAARHRLGLAPDDYAIGIVGGLAKNRLYEEALRAAAAVAGSVPATRVLLAGTPSEDVQQLLDRLGLKERATFLGRPDYPRFLANLAALDAAVALRHPTAGETSGTGIRLMSVGTPFITTDVDAFAELPSAACVKVRVHPGLVDDVAAALRRWHADPDARRAAGRAGRDHVREHHDLRACAQALVAFAERVRARVPAAVPAQRRWPSVEAVVIAYNGKAFIDGCLRSLVEQDYPNLKVTVVDNASADGTAAHVRERFPSIDVVASPENLGFAAGNNLAFARSTADYFVLLNQDAVARRDWVRRLVEVAERDPRIAAVASRMLMTRSPTILNSTGIVLNEGGWAWDRQIGERDDDPDPRPSEVFGACGGAMLLRRAALQEVGAFDPAYFMYFEDVDLCWRLRLSGKRICYAPLAVVEHDYHGDRGAPDRAMRRRYMCERNRLQNLIKNCEWRTLRKVLPRVIAHDRGRLAWLRGAIRRGENPEMLRRIEAVIRRAWRWNLLHLPATLWRRRAVQKLRRVHDADLGGLIASGVNEGSHVGDLDAIHDVHSARGARAIEMGRADDGVLGPGWHPAEGDPAAGAYRWSKAQAWFYLQPAPDDDVLVLRASCPPVRQRVSVEARGITLGEFDVEGEARDIELDLPATLPRDGIVEFCLHSTTFRPVDRGMGGDQRALGIVVFGIRVGCRAKVPAPA